MGSRNHDNGLACTSRNFYSGFFGLSPPTPQLIGGGRSPLFSEMKRSTRIAILLAIAAIAGVITLLLPPVPQPQEYHDFADQREFFGIPHFLNVASNLAFILVGAWGLFGLRKRSENSAPAAGHPLPHVPLFLEEREKWPWAVLFLGTFLTGFGSGYYHWMPSNETLVWDRLPMTLITMGLMAAVISERIGVQAGLRWLTPLLVVGLLSVAYWAWTDDLRLYGLVQFLPILLIPLLILLFAPRYTGTGGYFAALGWYVLSRLAEAWDSPIYAVGQLVSGHTLKHLLAAVAVYWLYRMISRRELVPSLRPVTAGRESGRKPRRRPGR
jgi:hypothetical protein